MRAHRLRCRKHLFIKADQLEAMVWSEVKRVLQDPSLIVAGVEALDTQDGAGLAEEAARTERELRSVQSEESRAIRLYLKGKITEAQLDLQRKFITERLESLRAKLDDYRARQASGARKRALTETVLAWAGEVGQGLDEPDSRAAQGDPADGRGRNRDRPGEQGGHHAHYPLRRRYRWDCVPFTSSDGAPSGKTGASFTSLTLIVTAMLATTNPSSARISTE